MNIKPYNELTKKEKLIIKYENKLSDFIDMLNLDLMELIDSDWEKSTGYFFPKEQNEILEDNQVRKYIFEMHKIIGDEDCWDIEDMIDSDIFWDTYRDLLEYLENKYC